MRDGHRRITRIWAKLWVWKAKLLHCRICSTSCRMARIGKDGRLTEGRFLWSGIVPRFVRRVAYWGLQERLAKALGIDLKRMGN